jgi:transglutaminase-like putative cysteine protease
MKRYRVVHTTEYDFDREAWDFDLIARLQPRQTALQQCDYFQIVSRPTAELETLALDAFGNRVHRLKVPTRLQRLKISAVSTVTIRDSQNHGFDPIPEQTVEYGRVDLSRASIFLDATPLTPISEEIAGYARGQVKPDQSVAVQADTLTRQIHADLAFAAGATRDRSSADEVLALGKGVCQDFTHLAIACARALGWPARYVSGYVHTAAFQGQAHRIAADASHAWLEIFDPRIGWLGFDPTNRRRVDHHYVIVARGRDYDDVCPLEGSFKGGGAHRLQVAVDVQAAG